MSKHTPGPWKVDSYETVTIKAEKEDKIAMLTWLKGPYGDLGRKSDEEVKANARLIASAPELLEALKVTTSLCRLKYGNLDAEVYNEILRIESIIAKAEGKV